jgi:hypothetical protein
MRHLPDIAAWARFPAILKVLEFSGQHSYEVLSILGF